MLFVCIIFVCICLGWGCLFLALMASVVVSEDGDVAISVTVIVVSESVQYFVSRIVLIVMWQFYYWYCKKLSFASELPFVVVIAVIFCCTFILIYTIYFSCLCITSLSVMYFHFIGFDFHDLLSFLHSV